MNRPSLPLSTARTAACAESSLTQPQMVVMSDIEDPFVPLPDDLLVNLTESRAVVEALLESLPATFAGNAQVDLSATDHLPSAEALPTDAR